MKALVLAIAIALLAPAPALASSTWRMEERPRATVMHNNTYPSLNGRIGRKVTPGGGIYRFPGGLNPNRQKLAWVSDRPGLDPMRGAYAVTIRFRTRQRGLGLSAPNFVQKGQSNQPGGFWKLAQNRGWARCHFRDAAGTTSATGFVYGSRRQKINDGNWHTVTCARLANGKTRISQDGRWSKTNHKRTGLLNNSRPFTIGGKPDCFQRGVTCDYLQGSVAYVTLRRG